MNNKYKSNGQANAKYMLTNKNLVDSIENTRLHLYIKRYTEVIRKQNSLIEATL